MLAPLVSIILIAWFPVAILLFSKMPTRRAVIFGVLAATMFLPMSELPMSLIPGRKDVLINLGLLLAGLLMDPHPLLAFRPRLVDLPIAVLCATPFISATINGLPVYNACSSSLAAFVTWGVPYLIGRAYLTDFAAIWQLAHGIVVAGLIYAPGCILEMFLGPQLHERIYGFPAFADYLQSIRGSGYRPNMFMQHGLMVSTFMCCAAMMALWLWRGKAFRKFMGLPAGVTVAGLTLVAIGCKSAGAMILMLVGVGVLLFTRYTRRGVLVYLLAAAPVAYILARTIGGWTGENAVQLSNDLLGEDKGGSLQVRFGNENILVERAMLKPIFGYGTDGDFLIKDFNRRVVSIPDGLWIIAVGGGGLVGLSALFASLLLPPILLLRRFPAKTWSHPAMAAPAALSVFLITYAIDCLMNAMINPIYLVALGSVGALAVARNPMPRRAAARLRPQGRSPSMPTVTRRPQPGNQPRVPALPAGQ